MMMANYAETCSEIYSKEEKKKKKKKKEKEDEH
jgi:hypothetical protein